MKLLAILYLLLQLLNDSHADRAIFSSAHEGNGERLLKNKKAKSSPPFLDTKKTAHSSKRPLKGSLQKAPVVSPVKTSPGSKKVFNVALPIVPVVSPAKASKHIEQVPIKVALPVAPANLSTEPSTVIKTMLFSLKLITDDYPNETGWKLSLISPKTSVIASRDFGAYDREKTLYEEYYNIETGGTYQFEIIDIFGDGLEPPAYYSISLDGVSILRDSESCSSFTSDSKITMFYAGDAIINATDPEVCPVGMKYNNCCQGCGAVFTSKLDLPNAIDSIMDACVVETMTLGDVNCWDIEKIRSDLYADSIQNWNTSCWNLNKTVCPAKSRYNSCCNSCDGAIFTSKVELKSAVQNYPDNIFVMGNINCWNVEQVTDLSYLFSNLGNFNELIECWNISQVTNMSSMLSDAAIYNQPLNQWDTSQVTDMSWLFFNAFSFNQPLNHWNTSKVTDMTGLFYWADTFNQPLNQWNTSQVRDMKWVFYGTTSFNQPLNQWNTSQVTTMYSLFNSASSFDQPLNQWDTSQVTDMSWLFFSAFSFNQPLNHWNTSKVTDMTAMFKAASSFNQPLDQWDTSQVRNMWSMFSEATSFNGPLNRWDTSQVADMSEMFKEAYSFNQPLNEWNTSRVTNMFAMFWGSFYHAFIFNQPLEQWDTSKVTNMAWMFANAASFNQPLNQWNTSKVTNMVSMFFYSKSFNQPLDLWDTSQVLYMSYMFCKASSINQPLNQWNTSQVEKMNHMFDYAHSFNQPIGQWNTIHVRDMSWMFLGAYSFNQPLNQWDTSQVTNMMGMFDHASSFNQPLNRWNTSKVTDFSYMFYYASTFNQSLCQWYNQITTAVLGSMSHMFFESSCDYEEDPNFITKKSLCASCYAPIPLSLKLIRSDIDNLIKSDLTLIPKFVRLGFHDCVDKCDGCVNLGNPFNEGLNIPIDALDSIVKKYTINQYTGFSRADIWALAALAAANVSQTTVDFPFSWVGRVDCDGEARKGPNREMPLPDFNTTQVIDYFQAHFNISKRPFNERQIVALMGAHNLGSAHLSISGFSGSWVIRNDTLSNAYYKNLANPNRTQIFLTSTKRWQWELDDLMMLNADMALVREFEVENDKKPGNIAGQVLCPLLAINENRSTCPFANITNAFVEQYKNDETLWLHDFKDVYTAMLVNGYDASYCGASICKIGEENNLVIVCEERDFEGLCVKLPSGAYELRDLEKKGLTRNVSSIKIPNGYYVTAFRYYARYSTYIDYGPSVTFVNDTLFVGDDWYDNISLVWVQPSNMISVCQESDFEGGCVNLAAGSYDLSDLSAKGIPYGKINSIMVPYGFFVSTFVTKFGGVTFNEYFDRLRGQYPITYLKVFTNCSPKTAYTPPPGCQIKCLNLTSAIETKTKFIDPINIYLNNMSDAGPNMTINLCPGSYSWPTGARVLLRRTDTNTNVTLTINCCGDVGGCIFDGDGQTYSMPLFTFETPILLTMRSLTFQNFNHSGDPNNNGAIIRTTSFTDVNLDFLNVNHVTSQGHGGVFSFENPTIANITSSNFSSNSAGADGGVIYFFSTSLMALWGNTFSNNQARKGGALYSVFSYTHAECNRFHNNLATEGSGAAVSLESSTIDFNGDVFTNLTKFWLNDRDAADQEISNDIVIVCDNENFKGFCVDMPLGWYDLNELYKLKIQDGWVSSIKVPNGYYVIAFRDADFSGENVTFYSDTGHFEDGWGNAISAIWVRPRNMIGLCKGDISDFANYAYSCRDFSAGYFSESYLQKNDGFFREGFITSIVVPNGHYVTFITDVGPLTFDTDTYFPDLFRFSSLEVYGICSARPGYTLPAGCDYHGSYVHLQNSGLCKQTTTNMVPTSLSEVSVDYASLYVPQCDGSDWKVGAHNGEVIEKAIQPYQRTACFPKPSYKPAQHCEDFCLYLSSKNGTGISTERLINQINSVNESLEVNLCAGTYEWPSDAGVFIHRSGKNANQTISLTCCGNAEDCVFDGYGQTFNQPLFQFNSPIVFIMKGITFQNFHFAGEDGAIITTKAFTILDLHFLTVRNVISEGNWGAFKFEAPTVANITNCKFFSNVAGREGGAITFNATSQMNLWGNTFRNNRAGYRGGALYSFRSYSRAECNVFQNNSASIDGTGIGVYLEESSMELSGDAFEPNSAEYDDGLDFHLQNSGLCKQSSLVNTLPTKLDHKRVSMDSKSMFINLCDGSDWKKGW